MVHLMLVLVNHPRNELVKLIHVHDGPTGQNGQNAAKNVAGGLQQLHANVFMENKVCTLNEVIRI